MDTPDKKATDRTNETYSIRPTRSKPEIQGGRAGKLTNQAPLALVIGNYRQTITIVRSLARAGYQVIVGRSTEQNGRGFCELSHYTTGVWVHPDPSNPVEFCRALLQFGDRLLLANHARAVLFPVGEVCIRAIHKFEARSTEALQRRFKVVGPSREVALTCLNKERSIAVAAQIGLPLPRTCDYGGSNKRWIEFAREIGYPCIIKPNTSEHTVLGRKALIVRSESELKKYLDAKDPHLRYHLIQNFFEGFRHNCHFFAQDGKIVGYFEQRVLRTDQVDGTGYGIEGEAVAPSDHLFQDCQRYVETLRYEGNGCVQFIVHPHFPRRYIFLEINPRLDATVGFPYQCGWNFPLWGVQGPSYVAAPYPIGARVHWLQGDLQGLLHGIHHRKLGWGAAMLWGLQILRSVAMSQYHLTWDWRDPVPSGYSYFWTHTRALAKALINLVRRTSRPGRD